MNGFTVEGYQVESTSLGSGCSGEVFRVQREFENQEYIAKRYNSMSIDRHLMNEIFEKIQNAPPHPGITPIKEYQFEKPPYYSVAHYERGKKLIDCCTFELEHAWDLICRFSEGLSHAHQHGFFHGNLHPGNLFYHFDEDLEICVRISDFATGLLGSTHYVDLDDSAFFAAPDQLSCLGTEYQKGNAEKWDVYRFGAIAFWVINGRYPRGNDYQKLRAQEISESGGRPVPLNPITLAIQASNDTELVWENFGTKEQNSLYRNIIEKCLTLNPEDRPKDMEEVNQEINEINQSLKVVSQPNLRALPSLPRDTRNEIATPHPGKEKSKLTLMKWFKTGRRLHSSEKLKAELK